MHKVTTLVHQLLLPTTSEGRQPPIVISMGKQQALLPRQPTILVIQPQLIEIIMATPSVRQLLQQITLAIPQQPIVTDMATPLERIGQVPIILATLTPVTLIPAETPEGHLRLQPITSVTPQQHIVTDMVVQKVHLYLLQITLEIAVPNNEATIPIPPFGLGNASYILFLSSPNISPTFFLKEVKRELMKRVLCGGEVRLTHKKWRFD